MPCFFSLLATTMNHYYSNDGGSNWEGPLSEQELELLRQAGIITETTMLRSDATAAQQGTDNQGTTPHRPVLRRVKTAAQVAPTESAVPPLAQAAPEQADIYLMIIDERRGPFTVAQVQGMLASKQITKATPMWRTGMTEWGTVEALLGNGIIGSSFISGVTGLGGFEGFSLGRFIGGIFQHHSADEMTDFFCSGSSKTTPTLAEINPVWPSPWIFARLIVLSLVLYFGFSYTLDHYFNLKLIPGFMFIGNFAIPFCVLILFAEFNIQRNISFNRIVTAFLTGGFLSLLFTSLISEQIGNYEAYIAGPVEEPAKLLAAIVIGRKFYDGRVLTGIVMGAAVGAGFAAFESAGYSFESLLAAIMGLVKGTSQKDPGEVMCETMKLRAYLSPLCHVVWTAITSGAFWYVMGKKNLSLPQQTPFHLDCLADIRFLRIAWIPVLLHMLWNGMIPQLYAFGDFFNFFLGIVAWIMVLLLVQQGIRQIRDEKKAQGLM